MSKQTKKYRRSGGRLALHITGQIIKWLAIALGTILLIGMVTCIFGLGYAKTYIEDVIIPQAEDAQTSLNTQAYDPDLASHMYYLDAATGQYEELQTLYASENRVWVTYEDIPQNLINATVAIEDQRFWEHSGVDWKRTLAAVVYMFTGQDVQGGSTITQQLIKNLSSNDDVTVKRKVLEIFTALEFDAAHEKTEILELYLNNIYLGRRCYGVYTAAYKYFAKDVTELDLAECACLISITNNPSLYDPYNHPENTKKRAATVIKQMYKQEIISEAEELAALSEIGYLPDGGVDDDGYKTFAYNAAADTMVFQDGSLLAQVNGGAAETSFSYYTEAVFNSVRDALMEKYEITASAASTMIYSGGLSIYTCYDAEVQAVVDSVYADPNALDGNVSASGQPLQSAITVVDNSTGAVVALYSGIGEKTVDRGQNMAVDSLRPPGSSIKPIAVYAPAIEEGLITPFSSVDDTPFRLYDDGSVWPKNSSGVYTGLTSIYTAVIKSLNTCAVKTLDLVGVQRSYEYLEQRFGISSLVPYYEVNGEVKSDLDYAPLALGGLTTGVSTYEMAAAYSVFARNGMYIEPYLFTAVTDCNGEVILSNSGEQTVAISEDTNYYMNLMLEGVVSGAGGTGGNARISGMHVAGKTGTTTNNQDRWFCGYTPYYTAAVWIGYEYPENITVSGNLAITLWQKVMSSLVEGKEDAPLTVTNKNIVSVSYCTKSGDLATSACSAAGCAVSGLFLEGDAPSEYCTVHTTVTVCLDDPIGETGMYRLAGEYCPEESLQEISVLDYFRDEAASAVTASDSYQLLSWLEAQGTCTYHTAEWREQMELMSRQSIYISANTFNRSIHDAPFSLGAVSLDGAGNPGGTLSYASSNTSVATVDSNGVVTIVGHGSAQITITAAATEYAEAVSLVVTVNVSGETIGEIIDNFFGGRGGN